MSGGGGDRLHGKAGADKWAMPRKDWGRSVAKIAQPHGSDVTKYLKRGAPKPVFKKSRAQEPTVDQIQADNLTALAKTYWSPATAKNHVEYNATVVDEIYKNDIKGSNYSIKRIMMLEFSQYLENYLWANFNGETASKAHVLSIAIIVNEKFRERVPAWTAFQYKPDQFPAFFYSVLRWTLAPREEMTIIEQCKLLVFLDHCFTSMEVDLVRAQVQRLVSLPMWTCLLDSRREAELKNIPKWKKYWKLLQKKDQKESPENREKLNFERTFLRNLINRYYETLYEIQEKECPEENLEYTERFLILMIDLEALLPTRRFFNTVLDDSHLVVRSHLAPLAKRPEGRLFVQLLEQVRFYTRFEINDESGEPLSEKDMMMIHYHRLGDLQRAVFVKYPELRKLSLASIASIEDRDQLVKYFSRLDRDTLYAVCEYLHLVPPKGSEADNNVEYSQEFLSELVISRHEKRVSQLQELNEMPLYPTEEFIWDEGLVPGEYYQGESPLALPKLNLQFLTLHDYLLRNFKLFQLESTYEIRQDIEDILSRLRPWRAEDDTIIFNGWARMAQPIHNFTIVEVAKPNIGETQPSRVRADVTVKLTVRHDILDEWESLRKHDVCFLVTVRPPQGTDINYMDIPAAQYLETTGLFYVRGCEVEGMLDENGRVIEEFSGEPKPKFKTGERTFRVKLDCNQYREDMDLTSKGAEDVYASFNILMRRKPKENNFKAVLETIRELMNTSCVVPDWLHDIILGYGNPAAAHYNNMPNNIPTINFNDTFLDFQHLRESFPHYEVRVDPSVPQDSIVPPFSVTFNDVVDKKASEKRDEPGSNDPHIPRILTVTPLTQENRGPYPKNIPKKNAVKFTPTQVEAIRAGVNPGLTMVVGPPGTGKTDVAVQIISNLYHNFPDQRTLIVTHSNQALNQLFEKIIQLDVDERHLLRLGHGEEALETEKDFSRYGRVNYVLAKRLELLEEVTRLQKSLGVSGDVAYTCETARFFYLYQVLSRWEEYLSKVGSPANQKTAKENIDDLFPFHVFFANAPKPLFKGDSFDDYFECAMSCWRYISDIFTQLDEFWAFELLRSGLDRTRYLCVKEAKIIAMTCTHAALKRQELVDLGFKYDNILMEESAQILEIETFIPLLLQTPMDGVNRLKRWIMIGDHHQLPPVVKNMAFEKFSNMEQSLFTRFVRLGVPTIELDAQGRARPSICSLYNWRYRNLGNLPHVLNHPDYKVANAGFSFDYQLINVGDFNGVGESQPSPFFYQNLAEAEFVIAVYMYMRLIGYPANKISILTTYNGQKALLRDVCSARCAGNPLIGMPHKIATVDKYQGQQNDYILLSLVRTYNVGHLRDVRRLVVAMSRARLGLYVFARVNLFKNCYELQPAFNILMKRPLQLHLCPNELFPSKRQANVTAPNPVIVYDMPMMSKFVVDFYQDKVKQLKLIQARLTPKQPGDIKPKGKTGATRQHPGDGDSDDEKEQEEMTTIENELETEKKVVSAENKAAAALDKLLTDNQMEQESSPPVQEQTDNSTQDMAEEEKEAWQKIGGGKNVEETIPDNDDGDEAMDQS